jgi:murein DD-endopeptidase MepM/ murein hydrolase activator NlpD
MSVSRVTSRMGTRENPFGTGTTDVHSGVDIAAPGNTPMYAIYDGVVIDARGTTIGGTAVGGFGAWVVVKHSGIKDIAGVSHNLYALYGHVNGSYVKTGDSVKQGQAITVVGNEGTSTGPHLHFEISKGWTGAPISRAKGRMDPIYAFGWAI